MAKQPNAKDAATGKDRPRPAVLFELENVAVGGRRIVYDVLSRLLKERKARLTPALFSRFCLDTPPSRFVPRLLSVLDKGKTSPEKLIADFCAQRRKALAETTAVADTELKGLLGELIKREVPVGALSELADGDFAKRLGRMGLADIRIKILPLTAEDRAAPTADAWLKLAKSLSASPSACIAVATGAASAKAAVSGGMRCVAVVDEFTAFQDFGGADFVTDTLDADAVAGILAILEATA